MRVERAVRRAAADDPRSLLHAADAALRSRAPRDAHQLYEQVLAEATDAGLRAEALAGLGFVAQQSGRPREAARLFEECLRLTGEELSDRVELAAGLGHSYAAMGELERATLVFEQCLRRARANGDKPAQVRFGMLLSYALTDLGRFEPAEHAIAEVVEAGDGIEDPVVRARVEWAQARLYGEQKRTELAVGHARAALDLLRDTDQQQFLAKTYELVASLTTDLGRPREAIALLRDGWPLVLDAATPLEVAHYRIEEARAMAALGERDGAAAIAMRVAAQLDGTHPGDAGRAYVLLAEIFDDLGEVARARQLYETGIGLLSRQGPSRYLADAYRRLAALFEAEYRTEDAVGVLRRSLTIQTHVERIAPVA